MSVHTFSCLDGHTCGNPVRLVSRRRAAAQGRHHERAAARFPRAPRLDPQGADVRAARPRRDVGLDPLSADPRRLRHRHPVHRGERLPADVRPRHHRHRHHGGRERPGDAGDAGRAQSRRAGRPRRGALRAERPLRRQRAHHQRRVVSGGQRDRDRRAGHGRAGVRHRLWRQLLRHPRAAEEFRRPGDRCRPATCCGCRRSCAGC